MKKISLSKWQLFNHFIIPTTIIVFPLLMFSYQYWEIEISKIYTGKRTLEELFSLNYLSLPIGIIGLIIKYRRLYYKEIKGEVSDETFKTAIRRLKRELELTTLKTSNNKYILRSHNLTSNYGKLIEVIKQGNRILFNEICFPEIGLNGFSLGIRKKELKTFLRHINEISKGNTYSRQNHFTDNQWSLTMILIRLFLYPLSISIIIFTFYSFTHNINVLVALIPLGLVCVYLYSDLYMIFKKK